MTSPDNERGRPCQDAPGKLAAKLATEDNDTPTTGTMDASGVVLTDPEFVDELERRASI